MPDSPQLLHTPLCDSPWLQAATGRQHSPGCCGSQPTCGAVTHAELQVCTVCCMLLPAAVRAHTHVRRSPPRVSAPQTGAVSSSGVTGPPPTGRTDLLLRFFESQFFDEWIALTCVLLAQLWSRAALRRPWRS